MAHALLPVQFAWLCGQEVGYVDRTSGRKILNLDLKPASFYEITAQGHRSLALENSNFYLDIQAEGCYHEAEGLRFKGDATKRLIRAARRMSHRVWSQSDVPRGFHPHLIYEMWD